MNRIYGINPVWWYVTAGSIVAIASAALFGTAFIRIYQAVWQFLSVAWGWVS